jgi:hypothetical protein
MLRLEKPVRDPENTTLKAPASKNLCNIRVNTASAKDSIPFCVIESCLTHLHIQKTTKLITTYSNEGASG